MSNASLRSRSMLLPGVCALGWLATMAVLTSRTYFLMPYAASSLLTPELEPFGASLVSLTVCGLLSLAWLGLVKSCNDRRPVLYLLIASLPLALWIVRVAGIVTVNPMFAEIIWLGLWTGLSFGATMRAPDQERSSILYAPGVILVAVLLAGWWTFQAWWHHSSFLMGFNDYGHFLQRVSNTSAGRGFLLETPVLPAFWDHFNPGLLLLVPLWWLWPDVAQSFLWQSLSLAVSGWLIYGIALSLGLSRLPATLFGLAWLVQPVVGQMNLAYSYGWHPITLAIPALLGSMWALLTKRWMLTAVLLAVALSMEEGVFVIVSLTCLWCGVVKLAIERRWLPSGDDTLVKSQWRFIGLLAAWKWLAMGIFAAACFVAVYKFSGLAEFQTGRFVALGSSTTEILLSPLTKPVLFWGSLLRWDRWYFVSLILLPCGLPGLRRGWIYVVPTLLPLAVLLVWDHAPAHSIAFQYSSILLPLFWLAILHGAASVAGPSLAVQYASTALASGLILSIFVGQLPFSLPTLLDVDGRTYGTDQELRRRWDQPDGVWLTEQIAKIRSAPAKCLATGRIAAHLVGMSDIETVGQFVERHERLSQLADRQGQPLRHYDWIVIDRREAFQQSSAQIEDVLREANALGFETVASEFDIVVLRNPATAGAKH